jgi:hypothetical protein
MVIILMTLSNFCGNIDKISAIITRKIPIKKTVVPSKPKPPLP